MAAAKRQQRRRRAIMAVAIAAAVLVFALIVSALGGDDDETDVASEDTTTTTAEPAPPREPPTCEQGDATDVDTSTKPDVTVPEGDPPADLTCTDLVVGDGDEVAVGDTIEVHYVGISYSNGEQFDASWDGGDPATFQLAEGSLIQGWVDGIPGMKVGGRRQLVIPAKGAYGAAGSPPAIGPNETLIFVIDLLSVEKP